MSAQRKYGYLLVGNLTTVSVPANWESEEEASKAAAVDFLGWTTAGTKLVDTKLVIVEDRSAEVIEMLKGEGKEYLWLTRTLN